MPGMTVPSIHETTGRNVGLGRFDSLGKCPLVSFHRSYLHGRDAHATSNAGVPPLLSVFIRVHLWLNSLGLLRALRASVVSFLFRDSVRRDEGGQYFSRAGERPPAVHGDVVVHQGDVPLLPGDVEAEFFAQARGGQDGRSVERGAVAEGDGFAG